MGTKEIKESLKSIGVDDYILNHPGLNDPKQPCDALWETAQAKLLASQKHHIERINLPSFMAAFSNLEGIAGVFFAGPATLDATLTFLKTCPSEGFPPIYWAVRYENIGLLEQLTQMNINFKHIDADFKTLPKKPSFVPENPKTAALVYDLGFRVDPPENHLPLIATLYSTYPAFLLNYAFQKTDLWFKFHSLMQHHEDGNGFRLLIEKLSTKTLDSLLPRKFASSLHIRGLGMTQKRWNALCVAAVCLAKPDFDKLIEKCSPTALASVLMEKISLFTAMWLAEIHQPDSSYYLMLTRALKTENEDLREVLFRELIAHATSREKFVAGMICVKKETGSITWTEEEKRIVNEPIGTFPEWNPAKKAWDDYVASCHGEMEMMLVPDSAKRAVM